MKYYTGRLMLGANLLAGCLMFQGCGLLNRKSDAELSSEIPGDDLAPVEVITDDSAVAQPVAPTFETVAPAPRPAPVVPAKPLTTPYTIKKGDTISGVAYRYYLRWQDVLAMNPGLDPKRLRIGQVIQLPGQVDLNRARSAPSTSAKAAVKTTPPKTTAPKVSTPVVGGATTIYTVQKGDSLSVIAYKHGIKTAALMAANNLKSDRIIVGQKLKIPGATKTPAATTTKSAVKLPAPPPSATTATKPVVESAPVKIEPAVKPEEPAATMQEELPEPVVEEPTPPEPAVENLQTYTVKEGEDVYSVAIRWGVSPKEITNLNNLKSIELEPGTVLKIPSVK